MRQKVNWQKEDEGAERQMEMPNNTLKCPLQFQVQLKGASVGGLRVVFFF